MLIGIPLPVGGHVVAVLGDVSMTSATRVSLTVSVAMGAMAAMLTLGGHLFWISYERHRFAQIKAFQGPGGASGGVLKRLDMAKLAFRTQIWCLVLSAVFLTSAAIAFLW